MSRLFTSSTQSLDTVQQQSMYCLRITFSDYFFFCLSDYDLETWGFEDGTVTDVYLLFFVKLTWRELVSLNEIPSSSFFDLLYCTFWLTSIPSLSTWDVVRRHRHDSFPLSTKEGDLDPTGTLNETCVFTLPQLLHGQGSNPKFFETCEHK